jgi:hypothetical protein
VKDVLGRFGFTELLTVVCPGILLLLSFGVWIPDEALAKWWEFDTKKLDSAAFAIVAVLLAYAIGMVLSFLAAEAAILSAGWVVYEGWRGRVQNFALVVLRGPDHPLKQPHVVEMLLSLGSRLDELLGGINRLPPSPYELVSAFRVTASGNLAAAWHPLADTVEDVNRRRLFAQGMALSLLLLALQCLVRLSIHATEHVHGALYAVAVFALAAGFGLRLAASRLWEQELLYTYRIYLLITPDALLRALSS